MPRLPQPSATERCSGPTSLSQFKCADVATIALRTVQNAGSTSSRASRVNWHTCCSAAVAAQAPRGRECHEATVVFLDLLGGWFGPFGL